MPRGWNSIFDHGYNQKPYYDEDYALWAYGVRFNEYDKGILAACGISWR